MVYQGIKPNLYKHLTRSWSSMAATLNWSPILKECKKFPPNTKESIGVYTAWIQPKINIEGVGDGRTLSQYWKLTLAVK